jgi:hypothetical protein
MDRLLDRDALRTEKGIAYSGRHLTRLENAGRFPRAVRPGGPKGRKFWRESEVDALFAGLARARGHVMAKQRSGAESRRGK